MDGWSLQFDGGIRHVGRLRVPDITKLKDFFFLNKVHRFEYAIYSRNTMIYHNLKRQYWWQGIKRDIAQCGKMFELPSKSRA